MARDTQRSKVYAWQRVAIPNFGTANMLTVPETRRLIERVHADVLDAGGHAAPTQSVKFTKRSGGACASWGSLNFTPHRTGYALVLHEIAHSLTWFPYARLTAEDAVRRGTRELAPFEQHALNHFDNQGHGPKYVACYIALLERYAGHDVDQLLRHARGFEMAGWGPWQITGTTTGSDGRLYYQRLRGAVAKRVSIKVDAVSLNYWRNLLREAA